MRKSIAVLFMIIMIAFMSGCNNDSENSGNVPVKSSSPESSVYASTADESKKETKTEIQKTDESSEEESLLEKVMDGYTMKEIYCDNGNNGRIYGIANIVDKNKKTPLVILSHGLSANHTSLSGYAERLVKEGYSTYCFDFPGGSNSHLENKSGTDTKNMSVITEKEALEAVLKAAKNWSFADKQHIYLLGESQGGLVTALTACEHADEIAGEILLYPAFNIPEDVHKLYDRLEDVPVEYDINGWITVGKNYAEDIWDLDVYEKLSEYKGSVLMIHGDSDQIVGVYYAEAAADVLDNCEFHIISGAYHGFGGDDFETAMGYILNYLKNSNEQNS